MVVPYLSTVASMSYSVTTSRFYGRVRRSKEQLAKIWICGGLYDGDVARCIPDAPSRPDPIGDSW